MGINGLLPYLAQATQSCHISEFRGCTVAVDSYCLLHKGANACAEQLARGVDNQMYVGYCLKYVKMFLSHDVHPIMVFDGRNLPAKAKTDAKRRDSRKKAKQRAAELLKLGRTEEAQTYLKQCVDITPKMAHNLIKACRQLNVDCIVAPYESDAQLAFFCMKGVAECVITEDSDLILFGCKKVLYKLDLGGAGRLVDADKIATAMKMRPDQFTFDKFRFMCILSGCDYVSSLSGIGLKKAEKFIKLTAETNPEIFLDRIPRYLNMKQLVVTDEYKKNVLIANATFLHQIVFDPYEKRLVHLIDPELTGTSPNYLVNAGEKFDQEKALQVALGNLNPYDFEEYDDWNPSDLPQYSIWSGVCKKRAIRQQKKETQNSKFQEYMKKSVSKDFSKIDEEQNAIELDNKIDKELSVYTKMIQVKEVVKVIEPERKDCEEITGNTPVFAKNPFLKKQTISKFPKTFTYGNTVIKSRFFCPETKKKSVSKTEGSECENNSNNDTEGFVEPSTIFPQSSKPLNNKDCLVDDVLKSCENTTELVSKKRSLEEVIHPSSNLRDVCERKEDGKQIETNDIAEVEENTTSVTSNKAAKEHQETKRIKLGSCRTIGLRKKSAAQPTMLSFFDKLKNT